LKLLFDQSLSRKLVTRLADIFPDSSHIQFHKMAEVSDTKIWEFAKNNDFCIVTQDADFAEKKSSLWFTTKSNLVTLWQYKN
jgi:predicted nuclease of predicted toxin-antitoxin system